MISDDFVIYKFHLFELLSNEGSVINNYKPYLKVTQISVNYKVRNNQKS